MTESEDQATKKLFRVYKTAIQMMIDRGYKVPEIQRNMDFPGFTSQLSIGGRSSFTSLYFKTEDVNDKIYLAFPEEAKFGKDEMAKYLEIIKKLEARHAVFVFRVEPKSITAGDFEAVGRRLDFFMEDELVVNITQHELVPKHFAINDEAKKQLLERYKVKESQLPKILVTDPVARYYGLRRGQVVKIIRDSETAGKYITYRLVS